VSCLLEKGQAQDLHRQERSILPHQTSSSTPQDGLGWHKGTKGDQNLWDLVRSQKNFCFYTEDSEAIARAKDGLRWRGNGKQRDNRGGFHDNPRGR
jgi:hypothetical protein